jgi:hypothetical protein
MATVLSKPKATKPGIKTTEFWVALLMPVLGVITMTLTGIEITAEIQEAVMGAFGMSGGAYVLSRGVVKHGDETPEK